MSAIQNPRSLIQNLKSLIPLALLAGLFCWVFAEALFGSGVFVFRDAGHYYYPLLKFVRDQWLCGRVPLWNPYENLGQPLAANATACVFYPGTALLLLPIDYAWAYKLLILGHVLLAAWSAYRLAREAKSSREAAALAAISYAFSGSVLRRLAPLGPAGGPADVGPASGPLGIGIRRRVGDGHARRRPADRLPRGPAGDPLRLDSLESGPPESRIQNPKSKIQNAIPSRIAPDGLRGRTIAGRGADPAGGRARPAEWTKP
jgi:hypothetical protein